MKGTAFTNFYKYRLKKDPHAIFVDFIYRRNFYGIGNLVSLDRFLQEVYKRTHKGFVLYFLIPPNMSLKAPVHKNLVEEHIKTLLYVNGWEVKKLFPFVDSRTKYMDLTRRKATHSDKKSFPGSISYLGYATKERTYSINCLQDNIKEGFSYALSTEPEAYFSRIAGRENLKYLSTWRSYRTIGKYIELKNRKK